MFFFLFLQDFSLTPPCQELIAKDLHGNEWKFRHIFRGEFLKISSVLAVFWSCLFLFFSIVVKLRNSCLQVSLSDISLPLDGVFLWVQRGLSLETPLFSYGMQQILKTDIRPIPIHKLTRVGLNSLLGMRIINCFWEFGVLNVLKLSCHHQFCPVIACTSVF